jgi:glycosyltransferase involved in cell wall biosynthesis
MRLVLDLQAAQCHDPSGDVGRYSIGFAKAIIAQSASTHEVLVALNGRFPDTIEALSTEFAAQIPEDCIRVFELPGPLAEAERENLWRTQTGEFMRENFIADLRPDIVHCSASFDGWQNDSVVSIGHLTENIPLAVSLLDSTLLGRLEESSGDSGIAQFRQKRTHLLKNADVVFTVSQYAREQTIAALNLKADRVVHVPPGLEISASEIPPQQIAGTHVRLHLPHLLCTVDNTNDAERCLAAFSSLPGELRKMYQMVFAGKTANEERARIMTLARDHGLSESEIVIIDSIEGVKHLLSSAALAVFPSPDAQIGLSLLDAMNEGAPVIGSSRGIFRELIGRDDALFDPTDPASLAARMTNFLSEPNLRRSLKEWSTQRMRIFSWETSVQKALTTMEEIHACRHGRRITRPVRKPTLAFVSPFPPEKTGIAGYSARLVPSLAEYYDVVCIANHPQLAEPLLARRFPIRPVQWFEQHAGRFDRILYQFGNSPAHKKMFSLLEQHSGVSVLHDFFLSDVLCWMQESGYAPGCFSKALNDSHGLSALVKDSRDGRKDCVDAFPCSISVLRDSAGVIVHSSHAIDLARDWYGPTASALMHRVPFLPRKQERANRAQARERLQIPKDAFVVCTYGWITPFKLCDAILRAWIASPLGKAEDCFLIFVGATGGGSYGKSFAAKVGASESRSHIRITGYVNEQQYVDYLAAADLAIQLRTQSRGETSATIFDCLAQNLPLIVNAHGSAAELPGDVVVKLGDDFTDEVLIDALTSLHAKPELRRKLAARAALYLEEEHRPESIAKMYHDFIEEVNVTSPRSREQRLLGSIASFLGPVTPSPVDLGTTAIALSVNRLPFGLPRIFVDITNITKLDLRTGIERVTRGVLMSLISNPPVGFRIEPVRAVAGEYVYAHRFLAESLQFARNDLADDSVEAKQGDIFLGVDWPADVLPSLKTWFQERKRHGVRSVFVVYDLLPLLRPDLFPAALPPMTLAWLNTVTEIADGVICISRTVADELYLWLKGTKPGRVKPLPIGFFQLGADLHASLPTKGLPNESLEILANIRSRPTFLMVGTVEPRKGHRQALAALELLWNDQIDLNLVIIGKQGWMMEDFAERVKKHPERDKRLFWFEGISDEMLEQIYRSSRALLAASEGEGFGLPLIEAAQYGIPIVARNLPVFREVASDHAYYFSGLEETALADALREWLALGDRVPASNGIRWYTWQESTRDLLDVVVRERWYRSWPS